MTDPLFEEKQKDTYGPEASGTQESLAQVGWRKNETLHDVTEAGPNGLTAHDLSARRAWNHGVASAPLSMLHKDGAIARLVQRRAGYGIYVLPKYVNGRPIAQHRSNNANRVIEEVIATGKGVVIERDGKNVEIRVIDSPEKFGKSALSAKDDHVNGVEPSEPIDSRIKEAHAIGYAEGVENEKRAKASLTPEQDDLREGVRRYLAGLTDQPIIRLKRATALALLEMIKELEG